MSDILSRKFFKLKYCFFTMAMDLLRPMPINRLSYRYINYHWYFRKQEIVGPFWAITQDWWEMLPWDFFLNDENPLRPRGFILGTFFTEIRYKPDESDLLNLCEVVKFSWLTFSIDGDVSFFLLSFTPFDNLLWLLIYLILCLIT